MTRECHTCPSVAPNIAPGSLDKPKLPSDTCMTDIRNLRPATNVNMLLLAHIHGSGYIGRADEEDLVVIVVALLLLAVTPCWRKFGRVFGEEKSGHESDGERDEPSKKSTEDQGAFAKGRVIRGTRRWRHRGQRSA